MLLGVIKMNFNIKDVKSWANRHDVKTGDKGYFSNYISRLPVGNLALLTTVRRIVDDTDYCFVPEDCVDGYYFFLPVDAVKDDKSQKKYRPIKNMAELADIMYGEDRQRGAISTGDLMTLERKKDRFRFRILITQLEYDSYLQLVSINDKTLKNLFDDYNVMNVDGIFVPFGVEVEND